MILMMGVGSICLQKRPEREGEEEEEEEEEEMEEEVTCFSLYTLMDKIDSFTYVC